MYRIDNFFALQQWNIVNNCAVLMSLYIDVLYFYFTQRQSYEWYTPKGVLKSNWMLKYLDEVPALVTVFHALDWGDAAWQESRTRLVNTVLAVK